MRNQYSLERAAYERGVDDARSVATWATDGNKSTAHYRQVLDMLDNGDPAADDYLPARPSLSGEYADDPTPLSLAREVTGDDDPDPDIVDRLADAYELGVSDTFYSACEAEFRRYVD